MAQLRIFSYLPNPRIWKATIAARLNGVEVEVRGARPRELRDWLWDFDARPLSPGEREDLAASVRVGKVGFKGGELIKTDPFLAAHPFGTVPAAFSPDGAIGIFESNSIMRTVARLGAERFPLYGRDAYEASRIDSFLDASLVFARDNQHYLLALSDETFPTHVHARAAEAFAVYIAGIEQALAPDRSYLVGEQITLADICFVAELCLFSNERLRRSTLDKRGLAPILSDGWDKAHPRASRHFRRLADHPAFAPDVRPYLQKLEK
ncbi:MAG: glutathione binding-like protein [Reyranellaceae bacterium]